MPHASCLLQMLEDFAGGTRAEVKGPHDYSIELWLLTLTLPPGNAYVAVNGAKSLALSQC